MQREDLADLVVLTVKTALAPLVERLSATEARVATAEAIAMNVTDIRDRLVRLETKAEIPPAPDGALRDRIQAIEIKAAAPIAADILLGDLKERLVALEARASVPGPVGPAGKDGKDGADGFAFDDLAIAQQDDRSITIKAFKGDRSKELGTLRFPIPLQRGVYIEGKSYESGDIVTWGGSQWYCNENTSTKPGEGPKAWTLIVKRGRDGKDGRDGHDVPVVRVS